jgi:hypothetical protein
MVNKSDIHEITPTEQEYTKLTKGNYGDKISMCNYFSMCPQNLGKT